MNKHQKGWKQLNEKRKTWSWWLVVVVALILTTILAPHVARGFGADSPDETVQLLDVQSTVTSSGPSGEILPDPCGLETVVCEGEELGTLREITAYTSHEWQTDDTPCIAADGTDICARYAEGENICASNAFPLGTRITVDKLGTCTVADRMNSRYQNRVDWYFGYDLERAVNFGKQTLRVYDQRTVK